MPETIDAKIYLIMKVSNAFIESKGADVVVENIKWDESLLLRLIEQTKIQCDEENRTIDGLNKLYSKYESKIMAIN